MGCHVNRGGSGLMKNGFKDVTNETMWGQQLQLADTEKYLGVILDRKLSWKTHVEYATKKHKAYF